MSRRTIVGFGLAVAAIAVLLLWSARPPVSRSPRPPAPGPPPVATGGAPMPAAEPAPSAVAHVVRGEVRGPDGPVVGAVVVATPSGGQEPADSRCPCGTDGGPRVLECGCAEGAAQLVALAATRRRESAPVARATTGADGGFVLEGLGDGSYAIWAEADAGAAVAEGVRAGGGPVLLELDGGVRIAGEVVGDDRRGLAGALVTALSPRQGRPFDARSRADGTFALGPLPPGAYALVAAAPGLLPARTRIDGARREHVQLELLAPRALAGRVTDDGAPAAGVSVVVEGAGRRAELSSDAGGGFTLRGLRPGEYQLLAVRGERVAQQTVLLRRGRDARDVQLALAGGVRVDGVVVDEAGAPVPGAEVTVDQLAPRPRRRVATASTDAGGRFRLGPLEPSELELSARRDGFLAAEEVKVGAVEGQTVTLVLRRAAALAGRVEGPGGAPVAGAEVSVERAAGEDEAPGAFARTGEDGRFSLVVRGGGWELTVRHEGLRRASRSVRAPASGVVVTLDRGAAIEGDVADEAGAPVAGAEVVLSPAERGGELEGRHVQADGKGRFRMAGLTAGRGKLLAYPPITPGETPPWYARAEVEVPAGGTLRIRLRGEPGLTLAGTVTAADGAPLGEASVAAWTPRTRGPGAADPEDGSGGRALSDAAGRFVVRGLRPGEHLVAARKDGWEAPAPLRVQAGDADVRLVLARAGLVRVRLVGDGGAPLADARVEVAGSLGFQDGPRPGEDGRVALPIARDGPLALRFLADGYVPLERTVAVSRGVDVDLGDVVLSRGREVAGRVVDGESGAPVAAARVTWTGPDPVAGPVAADGTLSGPDGAFRLRHVGAPANVVVTRDGYAPSSVPVAPGDDGVTVRLGRGGSVAVRVVAASGAPVARADVTVAAPGSPGRTGRTDAEGRFVATALAAGRYVVHAETDAPRQNPGLAGRAVEVRAGERVEVELRERSGGTTLVVALRGPGVAGEPPAHVGLVRGELAPGALRLSAVGVPLDPAEGSPPGRPAFELLEPGRYTFLLATPDGDDLRLLARPVDVGEGPLQVVEIEVPAELPRARW